MPSRKHIQNIIANVRPFNKYVGLLSRFIVPVLVGNVNHVASRVGHAQKNAPPGNFVSFGPNTAELSPPRPTPESQKFTH